MGYEMKIKFNKNVIKFFEKITEKEKDKEKVGIKLKELINHISDFGVIPFNCMLRVYDY